MANQIFKHLTVDVAELNTFQSIVAKQYDVNSRFLIITLVNEGEKINVDLSSTVLINAERADHAADSFAGVVNSDGTITVPITSWMLELDDFVTCDISILGVGETKLSSTSFTIEVQAASNYADDPSDEEQNNLVLELIDQLGGKANFNGTATSFDDCTQPNTLYNVISDNKNYLVGVFNPNAQWRFEGSEGIKTRVKINGTWRDWVWVAKVGITVEVINARGNAPTLKDRLDAIEENEAEIINIGTVAQLSDLDSAAYCGENAEFVFVAGNDLKRSLHFAQANDVVCSLKFNNNIQTLTAYDDSYNTTTLTRKINSIAPTFSAGSWSSVKIDGERAIKTGTIPFTALKTAVQQRIVALETAVPEKANYATINAIFATDGKILDVSKDVTHPALSSDATSLYLDKNVTTISKSTLVAYYPNLTTVYVDNDETDVTITGTGELTFVFKGDFNAGQLLYVGISKAISNTNTRLATLENTVGTVNSILQGIVDGGAANA